MRACATLLSAATVAALLVPPTHAHSGLDEAARALVDSFDYTNIKDVADHGAWEVLRPRLKPKSSWHIYGLDNPDPEWLPRWGQIQAMKLDDRAASALIQTRINKTWAAQCDKDFDDYVAGWRQLAAELEPRIAALEQEADLYAHVDLGRAIVQELFQRANQRKLWLPRETAFRFTGPYHDMLKRVAEVVAGRGELVYRLYDAVGWEHLDALARRGRSWGDLETERKLFCGEATELGTHRTYKAYRIYRDAKVARHVRWPVDPDECKALEAAARAPLDREHSVCVRGIRTVPTIGGPATLKVEGAYPKTEREQQLVDGLGGFGGFAVKKVTKDVLVLSSTREMEFSYDCVDTNKVERIEFRTGKAIYEQRCKVGVAKTTVDLELAPGPLPTGLTLRAGDVVDGLAVLGAQAQSAAGTKARPNERRRFSGTLFMVTRVERGGQTLGRW